MIFKNLSRRFMRSILTLLGISIGVAAIVALQAMANGMSQNYGSVVGGGSNDLLITQADAFDPILSKLDENLAQRLETIPGVENVEPGIYTWVTTEDLPFFIVFGYDVDSVAVRHYRVTDGKPWSWLPENAWLHHKRLLGQLGLHFPNILPFEDAQKDHHKPQR